MLRYARPEGSGAQVEFCNTYLDPVMNMDSFGNYISIVNHKDGTPPDICFTAHHDTVHKNEDADQLIEVFENGVVSTINGSCLGADCTTGVWLILEMIDAGIPGLYIVHAGEEIGCVGSGLIVKETPQLMNGIQKMISFDRMGYDSIVTHQMGIRTCSDAFARSLGQILDMKQLMPDDTGVYTDSNEYRGLVAECTNLSVGYMHQHTPKETQSLWYAKFLKEQLIKADWTKLIVKRTPIFEDDYHWGGYGGFDDYYGFGAYIEDADVMDLYDLLTERPQFVAQALDAMGIDVNDIMKFDENHGFDI